MPHCTDICTIYPSDGNASSDTPSLFLPILYDTTSCFLSKIHRLGVLTVAHGFGHDLVVQKHWNGCSHMFSNFNLLARSHTIAWLMHLILMESITNCATVAIGLGATSICAWLEALTAQLLWSVTLPCEC